MARLDPAIGGSRREIIEDVISAELDRQAQKGATRIDTAALADAIEDAIDSTSVSGAPPAEGKRPQELNATNDD
ncbi:hypothetical protein [Devosia sp. RR2S18]|uniref:hypothetical protein n=1 Tax=Devosia rhizosphaerae TaxID=3049774 RepID=UPI00254110E0|nr:hypothetical protein [Devosia sp. RR2S18]WIJ25132.1 hypothetical protein QOV41_19330 [Devosia sp. RR2S18]